VEGAGVNVGQAIGMLQLRVTELEEGGAIGADLSLQDELDRAQRDAIRFGTQLSVAKAEIEALNETVHQLRMAAKTAREQPAPVRKAATSSAEVALREENMALEARLRAAIERDGEQKLRIARLDALVRAHQTTQEDDGELSQAREQAAEYRRHIERLEAEARGYAMQISELRRQRDEANSLTGALEREVVTLKERPAQPAECPTCTPIIRAIADAIRPQIGPVPVVHRLSDMLPSEHAGQVINNQTSPNAVRGIADGIRAVLARATQPMLVREIAAATGIEAKRISTNIPHLVDKGDLIRVGTPVHGLGHRYWVKARPLPDGVSA